MSNPIIKRLVDWLLALVAINVAIWFVMTSPILPTFGGGADSTFKPADSQLLKQHVTALSSTYSPRIPESNNLRPSAHYIHKEFAKYTDVHYQSFKTGVGRVSNVVATFGPDTKDVIVIGAHYDAYEGYPGADGNASGVAGLIELANMLSKKDKLPMRIELVAYALAEGDYFGTNAMGSFHHAEMLKKKNREIKLMLSMDSIGYFSNEDNSQKYPYSFMRFFYPSTGDYIKISGRLQDIPMARKVKNSFTKIDGLSVRSLTAPEIFPSIGLSDNRSYWEQGYSAIRITDSAGDRNPAFHTKNDLADTLDYEMMAKVVQAVGQTVLDVSGDDDSTELAKE